VTLLDAVELGRSLAAAIADPANVELRQAIVRAIQIRYAQDPVFAEEFRAALRNH
jgi:hypothetical protein